MIDDFDSSRLRFELSREFGGRYSVDDEDDSPDLGESWREKIYAGEVDVPTDVGFWWDADFEVVGHGKQTNDKCGKFKGFIGCLRLKNHAHVALDGVDYTGKVDVKRRWVHCNKPSCPVCFKKGWAVREAKRAERRLLHAYAKGFGLPEHIIVDVGRYDEDFKVVRKVALKAMLERGIVGGL